MKSPQQAVPTSGPTGGTEGALGLAPIKSKCARPGQLGLLKWEGLRTHAMKLTLLILSILFVDR